MALKVKVGSVESPVSFWVSPAKAPEWLEELEKVGKKKKIEERSDSTPLSRVFATP